jgi:hypothetical protein
MAAASMNHDILERDEVPSHVASQTTNPVADELFDKIEA